MKKRSTQALSLLLAVLMLLPAALPASAATSATASTVRLSKTIGTVNVFNSSGRSMTRWDNMLLYNGCRVETTARSYAYISLDSTKLAKLGTSSKAGVRQSGRKLELLLSSGHLYFNVTSPLTKNETLNIRASTMLAGIRGTSGWVKVIDRWTTEVYVLEGTVQLNVTDPVTGQVKTAAIQSGEKAIAVVYPQDQEGDKCDIIKEQFGAEDIDGFVLEELQQRLEDVKGQLEDLGPEDNVQRDLDEAQEHLEQEEREAQDRLDDIEEELAGQDNNVSTDPVWEPEEAEPAPSAPSTPSTPSGGGATPSQPAPTETVELTMDVTAQQIQDELDKDNVAAVVVKNNSDGAATNNLEIDIDMIVPSGKSLTLEDGIDVEVESDSSLTVNGTVTGTGNTLINNGTITVNSSNTLKMLSIVNNGTLENTTAGHIVVDTIENNTTMINAGLIEGSIVVNGGTFAMNGGEVASDAAYTFQCTESGTLNLTRGTITNNGSGRAVSAPSNDAVVIGSGMVIKAMRKDLFAVGASADMPEGYGRRYKIGDGYYYMVSAEAYGDCGTDAIWDYSGSTFMSAA